MWKTLPFQKGDYVLLEGLSNQTYNREEAIIVNFDQSKKRFHVNVNGKNILIKPENLSTWFNVRFDLIQKYIQFHKLRDFQSVLKAKSWIDEFAQEDRSQREYNRFYFYFCALWASQLLQKGEIGDHWVRQSSSMLESVIADCPFPSIRTLASIHLGQCYMALQKHKKALKLLQPLLDEHYGWYDLILAYIIDAREYLELEVAHLQDRLEVEVISNRNCHAYHRMQSKLNVYMVLQNHVKAQKAINDLRKSEWLPLLPALRFTVEAAQAVILKGAGKYRKALQILQPALQEIQLALGPERGSMSNYKIQCECFIELGDKKKAKKCLKRVRKYSNAMAKPLEKRVKKMKHRQDVDIWEYALQRCGNPACDEVEKTKQEFQACPMCKLKCYCSKKCWKENFKVHKTECMNDQKGTYYKRDA